MGVSEALLFSKYAGRSSHVPPEAFLNDFLLSSEYILMGTNKMFSMVTNRVGRGENPP